MFIFRVAMTIINIFLILIFLASFEPRSKDYAVGALFIEIVLICNIILIWS